MEQDERAVVDSSGVSTGQGGEAPAPVLAGEVAGAEERVSEVDSSVRFASSEGDKKQDLEVPSPESGDEVAAASSGGVVSEDFEFRAAAAEVPVLGASSSSASAPATSTQKDVPAMADGNQGAAPGDDKKLNKLDCAAPGATVAIAHASPPDSYRRPSRSRKQYSPTRSVAAGGDPPRSGSAASDGTEEGSSSGRRPPSRGRKQPHPEHFIAEGDEATTSAKARRSGIALNRFITSVLVGSSASDSVWARNVAAGNTASRASGSRTRAATPPAPAGCGPRSPVSEPPRRRRR